MKIDVAPDDSRRLRRLFGVNLDFNRRYDPVDFWRVSPRGKFAARTWNLTPVAMQGQTIGLK